MKKEKKGEEKRNTLMGHQPDQWGSYFSVQQLSTYKVLIQSLTAKRVVYFGGQLKDE